MSHVLGCFVREGQTVWDVGAERGWFTLLMASIVGSKGRVDAFEAFPENSQRLRANIALNDYSWIRVSETAVSGDIGQMWFVPPTAEALVKNNFFLHRGIGYLTDKPAEDAFVIPTTTLDAYAEDMKLENLSLIKMDIEGAEVNALKGAEQTIARWHPILAIEYNRETAERAGSSVEELDELLDGYGYDRFIFTDRFVKLQLQEAHRQMNVFNVYCFHRSSGAGN